MQNIQKTLAADLGAVSQWLNANTLTLNLKNTKTMLCAIQQRLSKVKEELQIKFGEECLEQVSCFKYLDF